jgi:glyoxylase-like metal-dependent hydrolase (beta-lactamase superfamily II)
MMQLGDFALESLSDGTFRLDGGAMFGVVPKTMWQRRTEADDRNRIPLALRPLLIRAGGQNVLIDAGVGEKVSDKERDIYALDRRHALNASLAERGLKPDDIDFVIATHLHFDHVGGLTCLDDGKLVPTFRRARHFVHRGEWDDATHPHERNRASYKPDDFLPIAEAGLIEWHDGDRTEVLPGISVVRTGGHCRHHQIVQVESGGRVAAFVADLIPTAAHVDDAWIMGYDLYPMETLAFKKAFVREAIEREYAIFFEHDPGLEAGIIRLDAGRRLVERLDV